MTPELDEALWERGLTAAAAVYDRSTVETMIRMKDQKFTQEIVVNQFGRTWADPAFPVREKRLMVIALTTMMGRADLIEIQVLGGLVHGEFGAEQLDQLPLFLLYYAGAGNVSALHRGIAAAKAKFAQMGTEADAV